MRNVQRQAFAGMLWTKQFFYYVVQDWLNGDPAGLPPPDNRKRGRNHEWIHLFNEDIISMPDKWEYPWFAAWDLAFHTIPLALIDPDFSKKQLYLFTREWYQHLNGQIPAYEWNFGDVNPPVQAWAAWRVYKIEEKMYGHADRAFLEEVFQKLSLYFTWWVNRKDLDGNNLFGGGFLGLDNIRTEDGSIIQPEVEYEPAESRFGLFGGNSNWRGPVWFPVNFLIIESLQKFHRYLGDDFTVECPTGSGHMMNLWEVATEISQRLIKIFLRKEENLNQGYRPVYGDLQKFQTDPNWSKFILFHEYFHGDIGAGIGASR